MTIEDIRKRQAERRSSFNACCFRDGCAADVDFLLAEVERLQADDWIPYVHADPAKRPAEYGKYFVHRKDGKVHWETWNGTGWAYNGKVITHWRKVKPPRSGAV